MRKFTFSVASDMVRVGSNAEMADIDNRDGSIYRESWYIVAELPDGTRFAHACPGRVETHNDEVGSWATANFLGRDGHVAASEYLTILVAAGSDPDAFPDKWDQIDSVYGSQAYIANDEEFDRLCEERAEEGIFSLA